MGTPKFFVGYLGYTFPGGLIGGIAAALAQSGRDCRVIGVEPEFAADARESLRTGKIVRVDPEQTMRTMADGLRVPQLGALPFAQIRAFVHDIVTVSEEQIADAMRRVAREARLIAEPSGAVAAAGALVLGLSSETTVAILSGGNVDTSLFSPILASGRGANREATVRCIDVDRAVPSNVASQNSITVDETG